MKANEAPEKIYISTNFQDDTYYISDQYKMFIEYTRTDAFIEKACQWLYDNLHWADSSDFLEDFEKYMKGE